MMRCINPECNFTYSRKTKPEFCPACSVLLGGTCVAKAKKATTVVNDVVLLAREYSLSAIIRTLGIEASSFSD